MKTFIILILLVLLGAGAYLSRPTKANFKEHVVEQATAADSNPLSRFFDKSRAESLADTVDFKDRYLWVDVQKNGKTLYTGAFNHWFDRAALVDEVQKFRKG